MAQSKRAHHGPSGKSAEGSSRRHSPPRSRSLSSGPCRCQEWNNNRLEPRRLVALLLPMPQRK
eukprot:12885536-Prorocentrum_lima.AAC.1